MSKKMSGSEKMMFTCEKNGKRSLADFKNVEEALQASGGWCGTGVIRVPFKVPLVGPVLKPRIGFPEGTIDPTVLIGMSAGQWQ